MPFALSRYILVFWVGRYICNLYMNTYRLWLSWTLWIQFLGHCIGVCGVPRTVNSFRRISFDFYLFNKFLCPSLFLSDELFSVDLEIRTVVPNLWPAGQKWPARPQKVALDLLKNFKNICAKTLKLHITTGLARRVCAAMPVLVKMTNSWWKSKNFLLFWTLKISHNMSKWWLFAIECSKMRCRLGFRPRPCWESLQRSPDPLLLEGRGWEGNLNKFDFVASTHASKKWPLNKKGWEPLD